MVKLASELSKPRLNRQRLDSTAGAIISLYLLSSPENIGPVYFNYEH